MKRLKPRLKHILDTVPRRSILHEEEVLTTSLSFAVRKCVCACVRRACVYVCSRDFMNIHPMLNNVYIFLEFFDDILFINKFSTDN